VLTAHLGVLEHLMILQHAAKNRQLPPLVPSKKNLLRTASVMRTSRSAITALQDPP
jgi:hypothetical protein